MGGWDRLILVKNRRQRLSGNIVDLHARRIYPGTVEWADGRIVRMQAEPGKSYPHYIAPGLVDAHIHIESSLLPPAEFARWAVCHGTVATVSDPHEIANVLGVAGVNYMIRDGARTPFKFNFGAPSCVPATTFETAGARLGVTAVTRLLARREIKFLSEVMNFPGVLARDPALLAMIAAAQRRGKVVDGHAPGLCGKVAARYAAAGITTDHECFTLPEALDKLAAGMKILMREGSAARNLSALISLLKTHPEHVMFCCDDLHPDLLMQRHLDEHVRRALQSGADRFDVLRAASVNPVEHYGLEVGLLRVGEAADFIVFTGWKNFRVRRTYLRGALVASEGRSRLPRQPSPQPNKFKATARKPADFVVSAAREVPTGSRAKTKNRPVLQVIEAINGQLITRHRSEIPAIINGAVVTDLKRDILKIAVVSRYKAQAPIALGFIHGFGLKAGALASSVAHDSHNVVAVGVDDVALCAAINLVLKARGGLSVVGRGGSAVLPLPIAGLMSGLDGRTVARRYTQLDQQAKRLGSKLDAPFMTLSFMALLVIPDLKMSDRGLFSARRWAFTPVLAP